MPEPLHPTENELLFLRLAYERFYDLFERVMSDDFGEMAPERRFAVLRDAFSVYVEVSSYEPIRWMLQALGEIRPPGESEIGGDVARFVRNVVSHFPLFDKWDDVWISGRLARWNNNAGSIVAFLRKYAEHAPFKFRFWEDEKRRMTYAQVMFPGKYDPIARVFLKDLVEEIPGSRLSLLIMKKVVDTQLHNPDDLVGPNGGKA